jgi:predicted glutamine amidotransferase
LASVALENNHPFINASNSFLGNGGVISASSKKTHLRTKKKSKIVKNVMNNGIRPDVFK